MEIKENTVPGEVLVNAKIMIIGETPGVERDGIGTFFCGGPEKLLERLLKIAKIKRKKFLLPLHENAYFNSNQIEHQRKMKLKLVFLG